MASRETVLHRVFVQNWGLKLMALVLAALTFLAIRGATNFEEDYELPLVVEVPPGIAILDWDVRTVTVTFRGSEQDTQRLDPARLKAVVRPEGGSAAGSERVMVGPGSVVGGAPGVRVVRVRPGVVNVTFDREIEKQVDVTPPRVEGKPLVGQAEVTFEPHTVTVWGPKRRLDLTDSVVPERAVDVEGRYASFTARVPVHAPGDTMISRIEPAEITVKVEIVQKSTTRTWEGIPVVALSRPGAVPTASLDPEQVDVVLSGREEILESVGRDSITVFVDCVGLDPSATYELPLTVHLPAGVDLEAVAKPATVRVGFRAP